MFTRLFTRQQWAIAQQKLLKKIEFYFALVIWLDHYIIPCICKFSYGIFQKTCLEEDMIIEFPTTKQFKTLKKDIHSKYIKIKNILVCMLLT